MYAHEIKPILFLCSWLKKFNLAIPKRPKQSFIPNITHAVESKLCLTLLQQYWLDKNVIGFGSASIVVNKSRYLQ